MLHILGVAVIALGFSAICSAIILSKLNRHQRTQEASFEESLFEIDYQLGRARRGETLTLGLSTSQRVLNVSETNLAGA